MPTKLYEHMIRASKGMRQRWLIFPDMYLNSLLIWWKKSNISPDFTLSDMKN